VIRALQSRKDKWRPAPGGVSIGHKDITAGTLGCLVRQDGQTFILSNNHVLADSNAGRFGDPILQPGPADGGVLADQIATLEAFIPIHFEGDSSLCPITQTVESTLNWILELMGSSHRFRTYQDTSNLVDAAIARPTDSVEKTILDIGEPTGIIQGALGMKVKKSGRTTELTHGVVQQINATVRVGYGGNRTALFTDQLITDTRSAGGDSGSTVLNENNFLVGLLFAGSDTISVVSTIQNVMAALDLYV